MSRPNTLLLRKAVVIAKRVRKACEACQKLRPYEFDISLAGMCFDASEALSRCLNKAGIKAKTVEGEYRIWPHAWVESCGYVIDVTATQFSEIRRTDKVHVEPVASRHRVRRYIHGPESLNMDNSDVIKSILRLLPSSQKRHVIRSRLRDKTPCLARF